MTKKDWIAAAFVLLTFAFFGYAFFVVPDMTDDQASILRFLASASAGFAGSLFAGKANFQGEGIMPVIGKVTLVGTASFALFFVVWFSFGGLDQPFSMTVRVFDEQDQPVASGDITLHLGQDTRDAQILLNGEANFKGIPFSLKGDTTRVVTDVPGYTLVGPRRIVLTPDAVSEITMRKVEDPLPPVYATVGTSLWNNVFQRSDSKSSRHYLQIDCGSEIVRTGRFFKGTYFLSSTPATAPATGTVPERRALFDELHSYLAQVASADAAEASGSSVDQALTRWTNQDTTVVCSGLKRGTTIDIELRLRIEAGADSVLARARAMITGRRPSQGIILEAAR